MSSPLNIAIIGAGMAGASAARALHEAGHRITVFDKSRGLGGRMATRRTDRGGVDHGAQYFTARDPGFQARVEDWLRTGAVAPWGQGAVGSLAAGQWRLTQDLPRYVGVPTMNAPVRTLLDGLNAHTGHTLTAVERKDGQWHLSTQEHGRLREAFDALLLTLPLPQVLALSLPWPEAWIRSWSALHMPPCWAALVGWTQEPEVDLGADGWFVDDPVVAWVARNHRKPGRTPQPHWTIHTTAEWSQAHLEDSPEAVGQALSDWLRRQHGKGPADIAVHRWRYARCEGESSALAHWDATQGLGVAGDWLAGGRVEGAWRSGQALAQALLAPA
jgi:predicted NAD/FAD-dependent oxidoreductase